MRNLKLTLAYDGADFFGWQVQPGRRTVQGALQEALARLTGEQHLPQGSGRTDAGVHALAQVATWPTESLIPTANFVGALNHILPPGIRVLQVEEVAPQFHARASARAKTYEYRIYRGTICPPFLARYCCHHPYPLDEPGMIAGAAAVVGTHDFTSFAAVDPDRAARLADDDDPTNNTRTIFESSFARAGDDLRYRVRGSGFLHHMVRNLVGTFLLVGKGTLTGDDLARILEARDRSAAGPTAPAGGLYLVGVEY